MGGMWVRVLSSGMYEVRVSCDGRFVERLM